jgi:uncharacterized membrane protein YqaE (UPF0057 family)
MTLIEIIIALFLPPLAVFMKVKRLNGQVLLALVLMLLGHIPGVIYAIWVITKDSRPPAAVA